MKEYPQRNLTLLKALFKLPSRFDRVSLNVLNLVKFCQIGTISLPVVPKYSVYLRVISAWTQTDPDSPTKTSPIALPVLSPR